MRARVKLRRTARARGRLAELVRVGNIAAKLAAVVVVLQADNQTMAGMQIQTRPQAAVVLVAELALKVVVAHARLRPFQARNVKRKVKIIARTRVHIVAARVFLRVRDGEIAVCRQLAQIRLQIAADAPAPKIAQIAVFKIQEQINARK